MPRIIVVRPYEAAWQADYDREALAIQGALGDLVTVSHHIGSTAVPGLAAKPVIDILLEVSDLGSLDKHAGTMRGLGYEALGEHGIPGRRFYQKGGDERSHHIHAFRSGVPDVHRHVCFRDYLIAHPKEALAYGEFKQQLADRLGGEPHSYVEGKAEYVRELEERALRWKEHGF